MARVEADLVLLERFSRKGDADAFAQIVQRYAGLVYHTCVRILHDRARAEDVSQDTFFRLMNQPDVVQRSVGAWLHRTATRRSLDVLRSESARTQRERTYAQEHPRKAEPTEWAQLSPQIDEALERLPEPLREMLVEHYLGGKSQRELAKTMNTSPATVSRRMKQALDELRHELGRKGLALGVIPFLAVLAGQSAQAAPPTLMNELGKMAMISGPNPGATPTGTISLGVKVGTIAVGAVAVGLAAVALTGIGVENTSVSPTVHEREAAIEQALRPGELRPPIEGVVVDGMIQLVWPDDRAAEFGNERVLSLQPPAKAADGQLRVIFADKRELTLPIQEVRQIIKQQTGRTLDELELSAYAALRPPAR